MSETLLQTKLNIPPLRSNLVPRTRLLDQLYQGLQLGHKLTLVSAPAGFGKTTLLSEWLTSLEVGATEERQIDNRQSAIANQIAWLSLDEGDNTPTRFLAYLVAALNRAAEGTERAVGKAALGMLQSPQLPPTEEVLTSLINDVVAIPGRTILILDDYHLIDSAPVDDALAFVLEHLPPQMHLVIATRDDPQLPLARLRARAQLTELRALDLRFSSTEAAEFLNQVMGLDLSEEDIAALEARTEGWIAGLQLAAISMQGQEDATSLIKSFTGSHRFVLDYLVEEVLEQQPESIQDFLLQTAVLDRLTGPLCDALSGQKGGQATLEMLEHDNLFIVPLDEERRWYRYHHLFADLLRLRLHQTQHDKVASLQIRASDWFEKNDFFDEAIDYALRAEDFQRAAQLIERVADAHWKRGADGKLRRWFDRLPVELVFNNPQFCVYLAWDLLANGEQDQADRVLQAAARACESYADRAPQTIALERTDPTEFNKQVLCGRIATTRAFAAFYRGQFAELSHYASQALQFLPEQELSWRSTAAHLLGDAFDFQGDMGKAYPSRLEAVETSKATGNSYVSMIANLKLAIIFRRLGQLRQAIEICEQQMQLAADMGMAQTVMVGWLLAIWGEALAEINDLEGARLKAEMSAERLEGDGDLAMIGSSYLGLIRIMFSCGDLAAAERIIHKIERADRESDMPPWISNLAASWQARIWLVRGRRTAVSRWVVEHKLDDTEEITYVRETEYVEYARLLIAYGRLDEAADLLQRLLGPAQSMGRTWREIEILMLQALARQARGDTDSAMSALKEALTLAEPGGLIRTFVDEGPPMAHLLQEANARGIMAQHVSRLLAAFSSAAAQQVSTPQAESDIRHPERMLSAAQASAIVEPLSDRELEVLQLIAQGLSNPDIAARLFLALNTVKGHTRNIYGKLGVHSRTQAVAKASALGILPAN